MTDKPQTTSYGEEKAGMSPAHDMSGDRAASPPQTTKNKVSKLPAWAVGTAGEFDMQVIRAKDLESAKSAWITEYGNEDSSPNYLVADRQPSWDGKHVTKRMWFKKYGAYCDICSYETFRENCGIVDRNGNIICEECQNDRKIMKMREKKNAKR